MTKQEFIERYDVLAAYYVQSQELGEMLHKYLLDGHSVVCFGSSLMEQYILLLAEMSGVDKELIEGLLYEGGCVCYINKEMNHPFTIITAEDLWEFNELLGG